MAIQGREGLCYRYVYDLAKESMDNNTDHEIEIVHGRAVDPMSGTTIQNHAWIECELPRPKGRGFLLHSPPQRE